MADTKEEKVTISEKQYEELMFCKAFYDMAINGGYMSCYDAWLTEWKRRNVKDD